MISIQWSLFITNSSGVGENVHTKSNSWTNDISLMTLLSQHFW